MTPSTAAFIRSAPAVAPVRAVPTAAAVIAAATVLARSLDEGRAAGPDVLAAARVLRAAAAAAEQHARGASHQLSLAYGGGQWSLHLDDVLVADHGGLRGDDILTVRDWAERAMSGVGARASDWTVETGGRHVTVIVAART